MESTKETENTLPYILEFFRSCLESTPITKYLQLFDPDKVVSSDEVHTGFLDGFASFQPDLQRWGLNFNSEKELFDHLILAPSLQAGFFYRTSRALFLQGVKLIPDVIAGLSRLLTGVEIYYSADIGPGLKIIHGGGVIIGSECQIGSNFTIYQNVTIGDRLGKQTGTNKRPKIGDHVIVAAGAQLLGPINVGSRVIIGANSLQIHSVPCNSVSAGVPAKIISQLTNSEFQEFWNAIKG